MEGGLEHSTQEFDSGNIQPRIWQKPCIGKVRWAVEETTSF